MLFFLPICGKFTRAQLAHLIFFKICIFLKNPETRVRLFCVYNKNLKKNRGKIFHACPILYFIRQHLRNDRDISHK
jgi:hypothetical protein